MSSLGMDEHSVSSGISISRVFSEQIITFMLTSQQPWRGQSHAHFTQRMSLLGPGSHPTLDLNLALPELKMGVLLCFPSHPQVLENTTRAALERERQSPVSQMPSAIALPTLEVCSWLSLTPGWGRTPAAFLWGRLPLPMSPTHSSK